MRVLASIVVGAAILYASGTQAADPATSSKMIVAVHPFIVCARTQIGNAMSGDGAPRSADDAWAREGQYWQAIMHGCRAQLQATLSTVMQGYGDDEDKAMIFMDGVVATTRSMISSMLIASLVDRR